MNQDEHNKSQEKITEFVRSYAGGIWWDEEFYPEYARVLRLDEEYLAFGRKRKTDEWKSLLKIATEEKEKAERQALIEQKARLEKQFRDNLLEDLIKEEFEGATSTEKTYLKKKLQEIREQSTPYDLSDELEAFLSGGLSGIRKKISAETGGWSMAKKCGKYVWTIVTGIVEILVLLVVLNVSDSNVTTLIILGLAMIYLQIRGVGFGMAFLYPRVLEGLNNEFLQIRKLLGDKNIASADELNKLTKTIRAQEAKSYVQMSFLVLMNLIVIWKLAVIILS